MDLKQTKNYGTEVFLTISIFKSTRSKQLRDPPSLTPTSAMYDLDARALESPSESFQTILLKLITY